METETTWIDAWIRWDRNSKDIVDQDEEDDDDGRVPPTATFSYDYELPYQGYRGGDTDARTTDKHQLRLTLRGFPSESEQIWNSTGLTLWPSSKHLCDYLMDDHNSLLVLEETQIQRNIRAVELGSGLGRCGLLLHHLLAAYAHEQAKCSKSDQDSSDDRLQSHLYLTDGDTDTLAQLRDNVKDNCPSSYIQTMGKDQNFDSVVSCHQLLWGETFARAFCERHFSSDNGACDLVFGSDLVYAPRVIVPLFETVRILLSHNRRATERNCPVFVMAHSDRREGSSVTLQMVLDGASDALLGYEILREITREGIYIIAFRLRESSKEV